MCQCRSIREIVINCSTIEHCKVSLAISVLIIWNDFYYGFYLPKQNYIVDIKVIEVI